MNLVRPGMLLMTAFTQLTTERHQSAGSCSWPPAGVDEAHLLTNTDLKALRMLTNAEMDTGSHFATLLIGQPILRRGLKLAVLAALDQRISTRYTITGMNAADKAIVDLTAAQSAITENSE